MDPPMALSVFGLLFILISVGCYGLVLIHAFRQSLGTGFIVLCLPLYNLYYAFSQFEHSRKGVVLAGWVGAFVLGVTCRVVGTTLAA